MNSYISQFNNIAKSQINIIGGEEKRPWLEIEPSIVIDVSIVLDVIAKFYESYGLRLEDLVGKCFKNVHFLSLLLLDVGIKNTITIGNVVVNGNYRYGCDKSSIYEDIDRGYICKIADAHAWITLQNGEIIDLSIIPSSEGNAFKRKHMKPVNCVYFSSKKYSRLYEHVPYFLGDEYIYRVILEPNEANISFAQYSAQRIRELLAK